MLKTVKHVVQSFGCYLPKNFQLSICIGILTLAVTHAVQAAPAQYPLFLANPVTPIMMLNMSNDHQLYFKLYDDYADITDENGGDPDGDPDTTYIHKYKYYGYFDSDKCYEYDTSDNRFEPTGSTDSDGYCVNKWNGNFLNWATMTRMDAIRRILYGGLRYTDSSTTTVLERAFLPHDAHAFAKYYDGEDIDKLTPYTVAELQPGTSATGITLCNTTHAGSGLSQSVTAAPLIRVAKGNYMLWASNERWQCRWRSEGSSSNGNDVAVTGNYAYSLNPPDYHKVGTGSADGEFYARVEVCVSGMLESNCTEYPDGNYKPTGLLQKYGEATGGGTAKINFGLMTGSYGKNKSGGVLRRVINTMNSEINVTTNGRFTNVDGVIKTLNKLRIYGYSYNDGYYNGWSNDNCSWGLSSFNNGSCTNWGNPQAEIYLESLRYLAGKSVNSSFNTNDSTRISGVTSASWGTAPVASDNYCAPLNIVQFNASTISYDGDDLSSVSDITGTEATLDTWTDTLADNEHENLSGTYFIGANGTDNNELCTAKSISSLSSVRGTCPDAPRLEGSYKMAGLAYYARQNDIMTSLQGDQKVRTYGVALAPALPKVTVPVPGASGREVTIIPACRNNSVGGNCAIVDFKILSYVDGGTSKTGTLYVNWEDSEQGGDYDQDMWGVINYEVTSTEVTVTTQVAAQSTPNSMGFGYIISGTTDDGFHVQSGVNNFMYSSSCTNVSGSRCTCRTDSSFAACNSSEAAARSQTYSIGTGSADWLEPPLYYASKWGGYSDDFVKEQLGNPGEYTDAELNALVNARDVSDTYFFVTDPRKLEESLDKAFSSVAAAVGSASSVATNSTRLSEGAFVYQAQFNSEDWSGTLNAFEFDSSGLLPTDPTVSTADDGGSTGMQTSATGRNVYTYDGSNTVDFTWGNLSSAQKLALRYGSETTDAEAQKRVDWLLGNDTYEDNAGGLRERGQGNDRNILGDIVNSSPAYLGGWDFRYDRLSANGGSTYEAFLDTKRAQDPVIYVGANDGMVHSFNAETLREIFAYMPGISFSSLANITEPDYGKTSNPHQFIVDGPIAVGDVYINSGTGKKWHSIIVGTLGAGGRGVYALDVTNRTSPKVLFELDESDITEIGYVMGKPIIVPLTDGTWAAVFGNGDSSGSKSSLVVVDIENPSNTKVVDTGNGVGLSAPAVLPNSYGQGIAAYAGDLSGNLWKFDLTNLSASPSLMFKAEDSGGNAQPITAAPTLGINNEKGGVIMAYFGTGKYYDAGDNVVGGTPVHSFYAIADIGSTVSRSDLDVKTLDTTTTDPFLNSTRTVEEDENGTEPDWVNKDGWYLDFDDTAGERVTTKAILLADHLIFPTLIPSSASCEYGGRSWLMEVVAVGDKFVGQKVLENISPQDFLILGDLGFGETTSGGAIVGSGTDATLLNKKASPPKKPVGRQSWRQIK